MYKDPIPNYGYVMTVKEYLDAVECGGFIDYDGIGHPCLGDKCDLTIDIKPSKKGIDIPQNATHIVWFYR